MSRDLAITPPENGSSQGVRGAPASPNRAHSPKIAGYGATGAENGANQAESGGIPRLALNQRDAAAALSVSTNTFVRSIAPELRVIYIGRRRLYPVRELERWLDANARRPLE